MIEKIALRLLSIKSRSQEELRKKLTLKGFAVDEVDAVIQKFARLGYLNDKETTERRFKNFIQKGYGPRYVALKMREQGLKMPPYLRGLQQETLAKVCKTAAFKAKKSPQQQGAMLYRRGFDADMIQEVLGELCRSAW